MSANSFENEAIGSMTLNYSKQKFKNDKLKILHSKIKTINLSPNSKNIKSEHLKSDLNENSKVLYFNT
jgi:plasmid maintenance system killer protein